MGTPTTLQYAILGLLDEAPLSGYDIRRSFEASPLGNYSDSPGSIYPALRRLEALGLVSRRPDRAATGRGREEWSLTPAGRSAFRQWLTRPLTRRDLAERHDDELLRFAFMGSSNTHVNACGFLEAYVTHMNAEIEAVEQWLGTPDAAAVPWTGREALAMGLEVQRARHAWAVGALRRAKRRKEL